jgi:hypothetical protein
LFSQPKGYAAFFPFTHFLTVARSDGFYTYERIFDYFVGAIIGDEYRKSGAFLFFHEIYVSIPQGDATDGEMEQYGYCYPHVQT